MAIDQHCCKGCSEPAPDCVVRNTPIAEKFFEAILDKQKLNSASDGDTYDPDENPTGVPRYP